MPVSLTCKACGIGFLRPPSQFGIQYCSRQCWVVFSKGKGLTGPITVREFSCSHCGKVFKARPSKSARRYCSRHCLAAGRLRTHSKSARVACWCRHCGVEFFRLPCQIKEGRGRYCSASCRAYGSLSVQGVRRTSGIEDSFFSECEARGAFVRRQVKFGPYSVDGLSLDGKTAFEFDGEYWHSLARVKASDERKTAFLRARDISVVRIPERLYRENPAVAIGLVLGVQAGDNREN